MTSKHYILIIAVIIIVCLGVYFAISNKNNDVIIQNPNTENSSGNNYSVPNYVNSTTTSTTTITVTSTSTNTTR